MMESLFREAAGENALTPEEIPPIVAFTCIGPEVKLWLAYRVPKSDDDGHQAVSFGSTKACSNPDTDMQAENIHGMYLGYDSRVDLGSASDTVDPLVHAYMGIPRTPPQDLGTSECH